MANIVTAGSDQTKTSGSKIGTIAGSSTVKQNTPTENSNLNSTKTSDTQAKSYSPSGSNPMTQVRSSMNSMGFNNDNIGYSNGNVTYNGQNFITPTNVSNGTAYAPQQDIYAAAAQSLTSQGQSPIRQALIERGIDDSRIGWKNGSVTIDGQSVYTPQYNVDGTTYANETDINNITQQAYNSAGSPLVAARDYVTSAGLAGSIDWDGSNVLVGGNPIKPVYVQNGTAYVTKQELDAAIQDYNKRNAQVTNQEIVDKYNSEYGDIIGSALDKILNREQFEYDPDTDPVYAAYKRKYEQAANEAYRKTLNEQNTSAFGASGAALSQALTSRDNYLRQLTDKVPELAADAYIRYMGETDRLSGNLADARTVANDYYNRIYQQGRDTYNDTIAANQAERQQEQQNLENERQNKYDEDYFRKSALEDVLTNQSIQKGNTDLKYYDDMSAESLRGAILGNDSQEIANTQAQIDNAYKNAYNRGFFIESDEQLLPWLSKYRNGDGTYSVKPWAGEAAYEYDLQMNTLKANYDAAMLYGGI